ncbi:hypothetical protein HYS50_03965, partial [Candidatus Woesearchaeota archaeon]|nr:hypothetical protein [Candidatus Woesearchaeota archaeon]
MQKTRKDGTAVPIQTRRDTHYLGIFVALIVALVLFAVYSPVSFRSDITGEPVLNLLSTNSPSSALLLFALLFGILLLFFFTHRMMSR